MKKKELSKNKEDYEGLETSELSIDIDKTEDNYLQKEFSRFDTNRKNFIRLRLKYPKISQAKICKIAQMCPVTVSKINREQKVIDFINTVQISDIGDIIKLNFLSAQIAISKNLKDEDSKIRETAVDRAIKVYKDYYTGTSTNTKKNKKVTDDDIEIDIDTKPNV